MIDFITKFGISGGAGLIIGLIVNHWIEPTTSEGVGLILVASIIITVILCVGAKMITKSVAKNHGAKVEKKKPFIWTPDKKK